MSIAIRADASTEIGSGHVMRCLALAEALRKHNAQIVFVSRALPAGLRKAILRDGHAIMTLPPSSSGINPMTDAQQSLEILRTFEGNIDWLVVDHYSLDSRWESRLRARVARILVVDDLADRPHDCDVLVDQTPIKNPKWRYAGLLPTSVTMLLGPRYALLRSEFLQAALDHDLHRDGSLRRVLVFMGGSDPDDETLKAVQALQLANLKGLCVDVVIGVSYAFAERLDKVCLKMSHCKLYRQTTKMAELMQRADLAIGGGGTTSLERSYLGLPSLTLVMADNQQMVSNALAEAGAHINLGWHSDVTREDIVSQLKRLAREPKTLRTLSQRAAKVMGGKSYHGARGIAEIMKRMTYAYA